MPGAYRFFQERDSPLQGPESLFMRIDTACDLTGSQVVRNGSFWQTGLLIVGGDLMAGCLLLIGRSACERLCDTPVEETPMHSAQGGVGFLAQLLVTEVIGIGTLFTHNTPLPQFIQFAHQRLFWLSTDP